jgi:hypothetical protein
MGLILTQNNPSTGLKRCYNVKRKRQLAVAVSVCKRTYSKQTYFSQMYIKHGYFFPTYIKHGYFFPTYFKQTYFYQTYLNQIDIDLESSVQHHVGCMPSSVIRKSKCSPIKRSVNILETVEEERKDTYATGEIERAPKDTSTQKNRTSKPTTTFNSIHMSADPEKVVESSDLREPKRPTIEIVKPKIYKKCLRLLEAEAIKEGCHT